MAENIHRGGLVRQDGVLRRVPAAWKTRLIDFGNGPVKAITIPWGDVSTAYHSTGIPKVEVYMAAPLRLRLAARVSRPFAWLLGSRLVQGLLRRRISRGPPGPTEEERARGIQGPDGYTLTVHAALAVVERVLASDAPPGFQTPSTAYGCDFVLGWREWCVRTNNKVVARSPPACSRLR
jgi:short subunit dehydrogenase-like uncharacterized protein